MKRSIILLKKIMLIFLVAFICATLPSCIIGLMMGQVSDRYVHILNRAALTLIGAVVLELMLDDNIANPVIKFVVPYLFRIGIFVCDYSRALWYHPSKCI